MKEIALIILMFVCLTISGQTISQPNNRYRGSDMLEKKQIEVKGFGLNDTKGVWSLQEAEVSKETYDAEYTTEADTLMAEERGNRTYYSQERGSVSIIGSENYMEQISYDMPETWLQFPMQVGDSICGYFYGSGPYCERFFIRRFGTYKTRADAAGKLVLPQGDTLRNVIRLHTERYVGTIAEPFDTMLYKIPAFTVDSIVKHLALCLAHIVSEENVRHYVEQRTNTGSYAEAQPQGIDPPFGKRQADIDTRRILRKPLQGHYSHQRYGEFRYDQDGCHCAELVVHRDIVQEPVRKPHEVSSPRQRYG